MKDAHLAPFVILKLYLLSPYVKVRTLSFDALFYHSGIKVVKLLTAQPSIKLDSLRSWQTYGLYTLSPFSSDEQ